MSARNDFHFRGRIPSSKSILNRLLILQSFEPHLKIRGESEADDVVKMRRALAQLRAGEVSDCGAAGTTFRFLALLASRHPGRHRLAGSERLLARPQSEIKSLLNQLGCQAEWSNSLLTITGEGWKIPTAGVRIDRGVSSQFASALVLSSWQLNAPLTIQFVGDAVSEGYLTMTLELVRENGMEWSRPDSRTLLIPAGASVREGEIEAESDLSSAFAVAAIAALNGRAVFESWPDLSLQPDRIFSEILQEMGCFVEHNFTQQTLTIESPMAGDLKAVKWDLRDAPDLFPVLAVLCAYAEGTSVLSGAPHLIHKESNRIAKTAELLGLIGIQNRLVSGGLEIDGQGSWKSDSPPSARLKFDPAEDHRLAMAAGLAKAAGAPIDILHPEVVDKSFPEYWSICEPVSPQARL